MKDSDIKDGVRRVKGSVKSPKKLRKLIEKRRQRVEKHRAALAERESRQRLRGMRIVSATTLCQLCGETVPSGDILAHMASKHGQSLALPSGPVGREGNTWVKVMQGGLPSLGKASK
jgi:hypothetical protein